MKEGDEALDQLHRAVEVRNLIMDELRVLIAAVHHQLPQDSDYFDKQCTGAYEDGNWPLSAAQLTDTHVPTEIAAEFGDSTTSVFLGGFLYIPADK